MNKLKTFFLAEIETLLKGVGQIMLQNNAWTGLFFLAGIFYGSIAMGVAAILSVTIGTYTAKLFKYDEAEINAGIYGFSATLVGVALTCLFDPTLIIWLCIVIGSVLATVLQHFFSIKKITAFTFPFIVVTWVFLFVFHQFPSLAEAQVPIADNALNNWFAAMTLSFGQVIFQGSYLPGLLFFCGVFINHPIAAIYGEVAAALCSLVAYQLGQPINDIYLGLLGYNGVLCAITFSGKKISDFILAFISVILSVLITIQMRNMGLPVLTFPFVLATWLTLLVKRAAKIRS
ncbi:MAG: urea transporter [Bacteroidota bacterium]